ncbi:MAG: pyridoxamine 5'-phosphate oxidase [Phycisphaerae bacterium]|nr:pyridoxamine 5'-phosphate oxidase [Phycisphaerae bacterium]
MSIIIDQLTRLLSVADLPDPPPADPMPLLQRWLDDAAASKRYDDPNAMALATADAAGAPSVRMVLCKSVEPADGALVFFTNYHSRKGRDLDANPRCAAVFHWPHARRQARAEGTVRRLTDAESDAYFDSRPLLSRIGAVVSRQSEPIASRAELVSAAVRLAGSAALGHAVRRPPHWGGYRLTAHTVELWSGHDGRLHQRVQWTRAAPAAPWTYRLLSP